MIFKLQLKKNTPLISMALLIGLIGIMPHTFFSLQLREFNYFKSAYDEDYYIVQAIQGNIQLYRLASSILTRIIYFLVGNNFEKTLVVADFIFPFLCSISAILVASVLVNGTFQRILIVLFLLFGQELLSLGSSAIWSDPTKMWSLSFLRSQFPSWGETIIPDYFTSYFSLFRSPEPQISWILLYCYLGFLAKYFTNPKIPLGRWHFRVTLLLLDTLLAFSYIFISFPLIILKFIFGTSLYLLGQKRTSIYMTASGFYVLVLILMGHLSSFQNSDSTSSFSLIFSSRLPILTPSVLFSFLGFIVIVLFWQKQYVKNKNVLIISAICLGMPVLLTNQQIITGIMISTKEWERYTNYQFLVFGVSLFLSSVNLDRAKVVERIQNFIIIILVLYLSGLIVVGQHTTYKQWYGNNELVVVQKRVLNKVINNSQYSQAQVLIEKPGLEPTLAIKLNKEIKFITDYRDIFMHPVLDMSTNGSIPSNQSLHKENLFEFFARTAKTPSEVSKILRDEAKQKTGWHLGFFFSFKDFWYPATDNRGVKQDEILKNINLIVSAYTEYLNNFNSRWFKTTLLLSDTSPEKIRRNPIWSNYLLAEGIAGQTKIYVYVQIVKSNLQYL